MSKYLDRTGELQSSPTLTMQPEVSDPTGRYSMFNTGGVEMEVADFLYALVRMTKPKFILETGTHKGISAAYMGLALQDDWMTQQLNHGTDQPLPGRLVTCEVIQEHADTAAALWRTLGLVQREVIEQHMGASLAYTSPEPIDLLFLDSEPQYRFDELLRFWPQVVDGGLVLVHDLHPSLGHTGQVLNGEMDWPYGDFREKLADLILSNQAQVTTFRTPRGLTMFQKAAGDFAHMQLRKGEL